MTSLESALLVVAGLVAMVNWYAVARQEPQLERATKPAVIVVLIAAVLLGDPEARTVSLLLAGALGASLVGDLLLLPPVRFTWGLIAFLLAHVAYLAAFLLGPLDIGLAGLGAAIGLVMLVFAGRPILAGATRAGMKRAVVAYFGAITLMTIVATASGSPIAAMGAWLFIASDAHLGWRQFVTASDARDAAPPWHRLGVMVPYHLGQILLTAAILMQRAR